MSSCFQITSFARKSEQEAGRPYYLCVLHLDDGSTIIGHQYPKGVPQPLAPLAVTADRPDTTEYRLELERLGAFGSDGRRAFLARWLKLDPERRAALEASASQKPTEEAVDLAKVNPNA